MSSRWPGNSCPSPHAVLKQGGEIVFLAEKADPVILLLTVAFVVNSFVVLPLLARLTGYGHCPQKEDCPRMSRGKEEGRARSS